MPQPFADILHTDNRTPFEDMFEFEAAGMAHPVLASGHGPGVILMHELPGFVSEFWRLAHWIEAAGFRVYAPAYLARSGAPLNRVQAEIGMVKGMARVCVSREIRLFSRHGGSPVSDWLRALARQAHAECGGPGVGAVGLCLSGNFAWSVAIDPSVQAAVAAEPSVPLTNRSGLHLSRDEAAGLKARADLPVMALRFDGDPACRAQRFAAFTTLIGPERALTRVLPDDAKNPKGNPFPHAVLTKDLIAADGQPTLEAAREVLGYLTARLKDG